MQDSVWGRWAKHQTQTVFHHVFHLMMYLGSLGGWKSVFPFRRRLSVRSKIARKQSQQNCCQLFSSPVLKKGYIWGMLDSLGLGLHAVGMEVSTAIMLSEVWLFNFIFIWFFNLIWTSTSVWEAQDWQLLLIFNGCQREDATHRTLLPGIYRLAFDARSIC